MKEMQKIYTFSLSPMGTWTLLNNAFSHCQPFFASLKPSSSVQQPLNSTALALSHCLIKLYVFR